VFLLDTNTCIRILNGSSPAVAARLQATSPAEVRLCAVVKAELLYFICGKPRFTPRCCGSGQRLVTTLPRV
jgi:predicted nucleic acid-binding protein